MIKGLRYQTFCDIIRSKETMAIILLDPYISGAGGSSEKDAIREVGMTHKGNIRSILKSKIANLKSKI